MTRAKGAGLRALVERASFYAQFGMKALFLLYLLQAWRQGGAPPDARAWLSALLGFVLSAALLQACTRLLGGFVRRNLVRTRFKEESEEARVRRLCNDLSGLLYYSCSLALGHYALRGTEFLPRSFGGALDLRDFHRDYPFPPPRPAAALYFLSALGHHAERLLQLLAQKRADGQFWSFYYHHFLTVSLMLAAYNAGGLRYGLPVLYLHDWAEPALNAVKAARELRCLRPALVPAFALLLALWAYTRVWAMCWEVLPGLHRLLSAPGAGLAGRGWASAYQVFALYSLELLNLHWFWLLLRLSWRKLATGAEHYPSDAQRAR